MDRARLLQQFEPLVDTPEAIAKLRRAIVVFGVSGELVATSQEIARWQTAPLGDVVNVLDSIREPVNAAERERRIAGKDKSSLFPYYGATQQTGWIDSYLFDEELVLLGEDGVPFFDPYRPKAYVVHGKCWVNNHAHVLRGTRVETAGASLLDASLRQILSSAV